MPRARTIAAVLLALTAHGLAQPATAPSTLPADATAEQVAVAFVKAATAKDADACRALVVEADADTPQQLERIIKRASAGTLTTTVDGAQADGSLAVVRLRNDRAGRPAAYQFMPMQKTDAGWRVLLTRRQAMPEKSKVLDALRKKFPDPVAPATAPTTAPAEPGIP